MFYLTFLLIVRAEHVWTNLFQPDAMATTAIQPFWGGGALSNCSGSIPRSSTLGAL